LIVHAGADYDGFYQVTRAVDHLTVQVVYNGDQTKLIKASPISINAAFYKLQSMHFNSITDIANKTPLNGWVNGDTIWLDSASAAGWGVYEYHNTWTTTNNYTLRSNVLTQAAGFGSAIKFNTKANLMLVGSPSAGAGNVQVFGPSNGSYAQVTSIAPTNEFGFGSVIDSQANVIAVGSPASNSVTVYRISKVVEETTGTVAYPLIGYVPNQTITINSVTVTLTPGNLVGDVVQAISAAAIPTIVASNAAGRLRLHSITSNLTVSGTGTVMSDLGLSAVSISDYPYKIVQSQQLTGSGYFGNTIAVSTDAHWMFVGSPVTNQVTAFWSSDPDINQYTQVTTVTAGALTDRFGSYVRTNQDGTRLFVGAPKASPSKYSQTGTVYVYSRTPNNTFYQVQSLTAADIKPFQNFGTGIATDTNALNLMVSAPNDPTVGGFNGEVIRFVDQAAVYGTVTGTTVNPVVASGALSINNVTVTFTAGDVLTTVVSKINAASILGVTAANIAGHLSINSVLTSDPALTVTPVSGTAYTDLGLFMYTYDQTIVQPSTNPSENFGVSVVVDNVGNTLAVGSNGGTTVTPTVIDGGNTMFDLGGLNFVDRVKSSGAVYLFEMHKGYNNAKTGGKFLYTQELSVPRLRYGDFFGSSVDIQNGLVAAGAKFHDITDAGVLYNNSGSAYLFHNATGASSWTQIRAQEPRVDIASVSRAFVFDATTNAVLTGLDYIDPAKAKVLTVFDEDIDYKVDYDPALYNSGTGHTSGQYYWGPAQVGTIWWNLNTVRYVDYEQDSILYRMNNWGATFPGSSIDVYEWVESDTLPSQWTSAGTPLYANDASYTVETRVDQGGNVLTSRYYFWVKGRNVSADGKKNSVKDIASAIERPQDQNIPYLAALRDDSVALYNINRYLKGSNSVLHVTTNTSAPDLSLTNNEFLLVPGDNETDSVFPKFLMNKLIDSMIGHDKYGRSVPDISLPASQAYGISDRPRQSLVIDSTGLLNDMLSIINGVLQAYPVLELPSAARALSQGEEPIPSAANFHYDLTVDTSEELLYLDTSKLPAGYRVLVNRTTSVASDVPDLWAIYQFNPYKTTIVLDRDIQIDEEVTMRSVKPADYANGLNVIENTYAPPPVGTADTIVQGSNQFTVIEAASRANVLIVSNTAPVTTDPVGVIVWPTAASLGLQSNVAPAAKPVSVTVSATRPTTVNPFAQWSQVRVQSYKTSLWLQKADWVSADHTDIAAVDYTVQNYQEFRKLLTSDALVSTVSGNFSVTNPDMSQPGKLVKIEDDGTGNYRIIHVHPDLSLEVAAIQNGTLTLTTSSAVQVGINEAPSLESRILLEALIFYVLPHPQVNLINKTVFEMIKYIMREQPNVDWVFKTNFIDTVQHLRKLEQFPAYIPDNQNYYQDYIREVAPYRSIIRENKIVYDRDETFDGAMSDFDLPAYYDTNMKMFRSPNLEQPFTAFKSPTNQPEFITALTLSLIHI
jgi:hypothetical protein